jgi:hypothetical protein
MIVVYILGGVLFLAAGGWALFHGGSDEAFHRDYYQAMLADQAYAHEHPDCTLEEAHRNRDRVNKRYGRI